LLEGLDVNVLSSDEAGIEEDVIEDKETFFGNAFKKADFVAKKSGKYAIADDSGICIEALDGMPGVYSARWAGEVKDDWEIIKYTLDKMKDIPRENRQAYFKSVVVLVSPSGDYHSFEGKVDGYIPFEPRGEMRQKLPYDVIFIPEVSKAGTDLQSVPGNSAERAKSSFLQPTFAQMSDSEKNRLSHRGKAFEKLREFIEGDLNNNLL
jgi:XTP/dITP diphosphohydrolase